MFRKRFHPTRQVSVFSSFYRILLSGILSYGVLANKVLSSGVLSFRVLPETKAGIQNIRKQYSSTQKFCRVLPVFLALMLLAGCAGAGGSGPSVSGQSDAPAGSTMKGQTSLSDGSAALAEPEEGLLRACLIENVDTMDVHKTTEAYMVPLNVFERLYEIRSKEDGSTELVPGLAKSCTISEDGRTYSFTLRDDAFFSDGTKVTASDVAFTDRKSVV